MVHKAFREALGETATQAGSENAPGRFRFDFPSSGNLPMSVMRDVEQRVNSLLIENLLVTAQEMTQPEAKAIGAMALFGEKYGDTVRVVSVGDWARELCGGTHVRGTGEIGLFRILSEAAVAAGTRRIEAVAGLEARLSARNDSERLQGVASRLGAPLTEVEKKLEATLARQKELEKELSALRQKAAAGFAKELLAKASTGAIPSIVEEIPGADGNELQFVADALKSTFEGVILLAGVSEGAVSLVAVTGKAHQGTLPAGKLIGAVAPLVGGKGGGKPDGARGGGRDASGLQSALAKAKELIAAGKV